MLMVEARAIAAKEKRAEKEAEKELARGSLLLELEPVPKRGSPNPPASGSIKRAQRSQSTVKELQVSLQ